MKALVALTLVLVLTGAANGAGGFFESMRNTFKDIGKTFSNVFHSVTPIISQQATKLLEGLKATGKTLLAKGAETLLGTMNGGNTATTQGPAGTTQAPVATRDLKIVDKVQEFVKNGEHALHTIVDTVGHVFNNALSKISEAAQQLGNTDFNHVTISNLIEKVEAAVVGHNLLQGSILQKIIENPGDMFFKGMLDLFNMVSGTKSKRDIGTTLSALTKTITDQFKPLFGTLTKHITNIGSTVKTVGTTLLSAIKPTIDALKTKLSGHIATLKNVGQTLLGHTGVAIKSLTDAVTDILKQTVVNAKPDIQKAIDTAKNAGQVALNHLTGTLTGTN